MASVTRRIPGVKVQSRLFKSCTKQAAQIAQVHFPAKFSTASAYYDVTGRYKEKLDRLMKERGVSNFNELKEVYKDDILNLREREKASAKKQFNNPEQAPAPTQAQTSNLGTKIPKESAIKSLASFVDVEKLKLHSDPKEIEMIWRARHVNDPFSLCATLPREVFDRIKANAVQYPMFILPLPRAGDETGTGTEMHFVQWVFPGSNTTHVLLTSLLEYKLHTEFARPHTTLIFHSDLEDSHGIVLFNGSVEKDFSMNVSPADAQFLVLTLQKFYNSDPKTATDKYEREKALRRKLLLELFKTGQGFDVKDLIKEAEMVD
ncbi:ATP11 protein-domain-containing protein [Lipomyces arxii]|uniref:ATP11 protein-domain-containing protein n=1 Tax=Lipomyces arxii TaxID=56418 RepID=UPI0034CEE643